MVQRTPPRLAERLLRVVLPRGIRSDMIVGDLREEFAERAATGAGAAAATTWYRRTTAGIVYHYLLRRTRGGTLDPSGPGSAPPPQPTRRGLMLGALLHDTRYAARTLIKRPMLMGIVVTTLALAIGANTAVFSLIDYLLFRPLPIAQQEQVVRIYTSDFSSGPIGTSSYPDAMSFDEGITALEQTAVYNGTFPVSLSTDGGGLRLQGEMVSGGYFNVLGVRPERGRLIAPSDQRAVGADAVVVLNHAAWQTYFGGAPDIVGRSLVLNGEPFVVIGVTDQAFTGIDIGSTPDLWMPLTMYGAAFPGIDRPDLLDERGSRWLNQIGRMKTGATREQVATQATAVMARLAEEFPQTNLGVSGQPEAARPMTILPIADQGGTREQMVARARFLIGIMILVLLIACANVANILVAQGQRRRKEFAVRLALGASRTQLSRQILIESVMLAVLGGAAGLAVALVLSGVLIPLGLPSVLQGSLTLESVPLDWRVATFTAGLSVLTGLVFGMVPALNASRPDLVPALKAHAEPAGSKGRRWGLRDGLVVLQVSGSMVLLMGAGLFVRAIMSAYDTDLGFEPAGVATSRLDAGRERLSPDQGAALYDEMLDRVGHLPGVTATALSMYVPVQARGARRGFQVDQYDQAAVEAAGIRVNARGFTELNMNIVSPGYFNTLGISLLQGRDFQQSDDASAPFVAVVNSELAETFWPGESAVGKRVMSGRTGDQWITIVGMVGTGKYRNVGEDPLPYIYLALKQEYRNNVVMSARTAGAVETLFPQMSDVVKAVRPGMPLLASRTLEEHLGNSLSQERTTMSLVVALGALALLVAAVGLYGLLAYSVATRRREIGIRNALGAQASTLLNMVLRQGMRLVVVGMVVGSIAALALGQLLSAIVVGVGVADPVTFGATASLLLLVALIASYLPARRAMKVDPVAALRAE